MRGVQPALFNATLTTAILAMLKNKSVPFSPDEATLDLMREKRIGDDVSREYFFYGENGDWGLDFHLQPTTDDPDVPHNFGWRGIGGTLFLVDEENDFFLIYMEQKRGGPRAPFGNTMAQRVVYQAMQDQAKQTNNA